MADIDLASLGAVQAADAIARGVISAEQLTRACLDRIAALDGEIKAFAHIDPDYALTQAKGCDAHRAAGRRLGPLHGVPVALKDIIDTEDFPTECGTAVLSGRRPMKDATLVWKLREAGAVIIGKTVTTEMAYFSPGATRNPHDVSRTPGGSSSGSAAAVAAGMVPLAIGSQTNGSIIRPGAFCGVYAFKPSHGLVSRAGVLPLSRTLDHMGPFARSIEDLALCLSVIAGHDPQDADTRPVATSDFVKTANEKWPLTPRFGFARTPMWQKADEATRKAFEDLAAQLGETCFPLDLPQHYAGGWEAQRIIMSIEMAHNLGPVADKGGETVSKVFHDLVAEGRKHSAQHYLRAMDARRTLQSGIAEVFEECNAILTPSAPGVAPKDLARTGDPVFCTLWSLLGLPSITLPLLTGEDDMPLGVQLVGAAGDDARLMRTASWLSEKILGKKPARRRN